MTGANDNPVDQIQDLMTKSLGGLGEISKTINDQMKNRESITIDGSPAQLVKLSDGSGIMILKAGITDDQFESIKKRLND